MPSLVNAGAGVTGLCPEFVFDLQETVAFCDTLTAATEVVESATPHSQLGMIAQCST
jgi:hypothetical protein